MERSNETDQTLIQACRRGDVQAWEQLLHKYERLVFSIPLNYGLSRDDAADIVQLTFTALIQRLDTLRDDSRLSSWLATVARRYTWRAVQHNRHEYLSEDEYVYENASLFGQTAPNPMELFELIEWLNQGLTQLDKRCRTLLLALYFEQPTPAYVDIAARLHMPLGSIGPTRARCLERLKQLLQES
jgi:RNA polymerase sigma factor (sigma-70 family)